jgi:hypothetical protein
MTGAVLGLSGLAIIIGALILFALSLIPKLSTRYPATRKQSGVMALVGVAAFIGGIVTTTDDPPRTRATKPAVPLEVAVQRQVKATTTPQQTAPARVVPGAVAQAAQRPAARPAPKPAPRPAQKVVDLSGLVSSYVSGQRDKTGEVLNYEDGTMQGVNWIPAPSTFQSPEMHVYRVVNAPGAWSVQWFSTKRAPSELVGTPSLRFLGTRGMQRVYRVEDGKFKGRVVTNMRNGDEIRMYTLEFIRVREQELGSWLAVRWPR